MIKIDKPKFDLRNFVGGELDNKIKYALIHDPTLEKSFVTIAVNTGSYLNPKNYDGLAHFLEHMLFMGSKKYPDEKYYFDELNKLGGYSNAYTDSMETVYYFNVFDYGLEKMFDIFSRFFIDPLFNEDSISRELNAVDNEHKKNINSDMWRKHQFMLDITNKSSSINNFGTGSLETLKKDDIRDKLIEFYNKYYVPCNISICIASSKPILELKEIIDSTFGIIKKSIYKNKFDFNKPFYSVNRLNTYHLKTLSNIYNISYIFEIPNQLRYLKSRYFTIFQIILLNKSEKSLYFNLTKMGYLNNINVDIKYEGVLEITFALTKEGLNNLDYIESSLYQAIEQINNSDINKYAHYFKKILKINYNTIHKFEITELCNILAVNHYYYQTKYIFKNNFVIKKIKTNEKYKQKFIKYINIKNVIKIISSQNFPYQKNLTYNKTREYKSEYTIVDLILDVKKNNDILYNQFDHNNKYLDVKISVVNDLDVYDIPQLISDCQWYGGCSKFGEPLITILLQINNNKYFDSATHYILTQISCHVLNFLIGSLMYKPFELGYSISFSAIPSSSSININISALNDISKIKLLLSDLNIFLFNVDLDTLTENYINNLIISLRESYQNINFLNPSNYSINKIKSIIYDTEYPVEQLISVTETINFNQIKEYIKTILDDSTMTSLVYGNIDKKNATNLLKSYDKFFNSSSLTIPIVHDLQEINIKHPNPDEKSNCVTLYNFMGKLNITNEQDAIKIILGIIGTRILSQTFFDELRTKKQLGYLVNMNITSNRNKYYITQKVQSDKSIDQIIESIHDFNKNVKKYLIESEFDNYVKSIKKELLEPEYSLGDKINKYLPEITSHEYVFNRNKILSEQIDKITKDDVVSYFNELLLKPIKIIINGN
jgi:insulysin